MIKTESIEALKSMIDIVDVVSNYVEIKKMGANFKSPCPFHSEKTPSFVVSPNKQIYHCFGCHASGDAIKFVQEIEKISYAEAIEKIAAMYNFKLEYDTSSGGQIKKSDILEKFNEYFKKCLDNNRTAKEYIIARGVYESSIEKFELGYAPSSQAQIEFVKRSFLPVAEAVECGALGDENGRVFARFVERITFPIKNQNGKVIGFGGRTITNHPAKYLNSPQTKLFNKSKVFYGINVAKEAIAKQKSMIVCEGYMDVIMLHQAGFSNAVAVLGTALTKEHLPTIKKAQAKVILAFDTDGAGLNAAFKSAKLMLEHSVDGGVAIFDKGLDPADMVKDGKTMELAAIFRKTKPFIEFLLENIAKKYDLSNPLEKEKAANEAKEILELPSRIFAEEYKRLAAAILKVPADFFKLSKKQSFEQKIVEKYDPAEAAAIKTMLKNHALLDMALNRIEAQMFEYHRDLFLLVSSGSFDSPLLLELEGNDKITPMSEEELISFLIAKSAIFYDKMLVKLKNSKTVPAEQKSFYMRKIMSIKERLKKGELRELDIDLIAKLDID
ncbi:MAG: DNA primase [Campylobacteraceae bacterium]|jgi:DNA primase|nr:DNA primase [Campylobacteraceae bacterium]